MNLLDLIILLLLAVGFGLGWYKGFIASALNLASYIIAWFLAFIGYGPLASFISNHTNLNSTLLYLTAGSEKLSDITVANVDVSQISAEKLTEVIQNSKLPTPIANMITNNVLHNSFVNQGITTLSDYFNQTIINLALGLISFLIIFFVVRIISIIVIGIAENVVKLPILKQSDKLIGGIVGTVEAIFVVAILFAVVPIAMSVVPLDGLNNLIQGSLLGKLFFNENIIFGILKSIL